VHIDEEEYQELINRPLVDRERLLQENPSAASRGKQGKVLGGRADRLHVGTSETQILPSERHSKRGKYGNIPTEYNGAFYASKKEASRAMELDQLQKAGEVVYWTRQVPFILEAGIKYIADFVVVWKDWNITIEDTKSEPTKTPTYRMKKKLFKARYGREITEI